jgi:hypothetical protein
MAFQKQLRKYGVSASYLRPTAWRFDDNTQEFSAIFSLFVDKAHSDRTKPTVAAGERDGALLPVAAKLRATGAAYEQAFGAAARKAAAREGKDVVALIYEQAKAASTAARQNGRLGNGVTVISDFGHDLFADAESV